MTETGNAAHQTELYNLQGCTSGSKDEVRHTIALANFTSGVQIFLESNPAPGQSHSGRVSGHEPQQVEVVEIGARRGGQVIAMDLGWERHDRLLILWMGGEGGVVGDDQGGHEALHVLRGHPVSSLRHLRSSLTADSGSQRLDMSSGIDGVFKRGISPILQVGPILNY